MAPDRALAAHSSPSVVTTLLIDWGRGDQSAYERLIPLVQHELRRLARRQLRGERSNHTLETAALVNEAYVRLMDLKRLSWQDRAHFFAMAARVMRRILVDYARARRAGKRGGDAPRFSLDPGIDVAIETRPDIAAVDDALTALTRVHERAGKVVELRFFGGLTVDETAEALGLSPETVMRDWRLAKAWLLRELQGH